jgi:hypothetical protein
MEHPLASVNRCLPCARVGCGRLIRINSGFKHSGNCQNAREALGHGWRIDFVENVPPLSLSLHNLCARQLLKMSGNDGTILRQTRGDAGNVSAAQQDEFTQDGDACRLAQSLEKGGVKDRYALFGRLLS